MAEEIWKAIFGFEGGYEVSDLGRVRSIDRAMLYLRRDQYSGKIITVTRQHKGKLLAPSTAPSGHLSVVLGRNNTRQVHSLVLETFIGPCPEGKEALHGNGNPADNRLSNLRWGTRSENLHDAVAHGAKPIGEDAWNAKLKNADIPVIRSMFATHSYAEIARQYGVGEATIRQIANGVTWRGF